jgi:hypothetical protein
VLETTREEHVRCPVARFGVQFAVGAMKHHEASPRAASAPPWDRNGTFSRGVQPARDHLQISVIGITQFKMDRVIPPETMPPSGEFPTPYPALNAVLDDLVRGARSALADSFVGAYL